MISLMSICLPEHVIRCCWLKRALFGCPPPILNALYLLETDALEYRPRSKNFICAKAKSPILSLHQTEWHGCWYLNSNTLRALATMIIISETNSLSSMLLPRPASEYSSNYNGVYALIDYTG
ncbi:hypothetical protein Plhal304r1_c002g0005361 [Plasmopara halstedii]